MRIFGIAVEVAQRSVKHSTEVLEASPRALVALHALEARLDIDTTSAERPTTSVVNLAEQFASRTGATAAEFLSTVGEGLEFIERPAEIELLAQQTAFYLDRGGATALQFFRSARSVVEFGGVQSFDRWNRVVGKVADEGNALVYDFLKLTPKVVAALSIPRMRRSGADKSHAAIAAVLEIVEELTAMNVHLALECFKSSPRAIARASLDQFQSWARAGVQVHRQDRRRAQAYFALESKTSQEILRGSNEGVTLESIAHLLRLYVEGLTGREMVIAPIGAIPEESRIGDGHTINLPSAVAEFGSAEDDFKLYKVLAAHAAGQIEFRTREAATDELKATIREVDRFFTDVERRAESESASRQSAKPDEGDLEFAAYSDSRHVEHRIRPALSSDDIESVTYRIVLHRFPNQGLATRIFTTLENGRIDYLLRSCYRGIRRDLDFVRARLIEHRPPVFELPVEQAIYEILFQITLCGGVIEEKVRTAYDRVITEFTRIITECLRRENATVADTLVATFRVYNLIGQQQQQDDAEREAEESDEASPDESEASDESARSREQRASQQQPRSLDPFTQWSDPVEETAPLEADIFEDLLNSESSEQELQEGDVVFFYDEWDRELCDHRSKWCRIIQRENRRGTRDFVDQVRSKYSGVISSIRHQFQMLKPESLRRVKGEIDGEDYDLQAVIDHHVDLRTNGRPSDRLYIRRIRREREVAVSFLLDMSSSTARTITRHPNQPYTRPGQKIIDIEKQGLVLMSEALEAVGDAYAISGFTSEGRRNVKYFVIKQFGEKYSPEVEKRIGGITYHNNTRLGAAIRHASTELERQDARTRLLIVLSDGRPYDHDYGDSRYAREDTKMALRQTKISGITPFCITIDRESEDELKDLYGEVGYTIIDDVMSLPERLPGIYRRLTT